MAGDGQITLGETIMKGTARKVRKLGDGRVLAGFAGSVADAMTLFEKFEEKFKDKFQDEIADTFIRLLDLCGYLNINIDEWIDAKLEYNRTRGYKHGKKY